MACLTEAQLASKINEGVFCFPPPKKLPATDIELPHVIIGDEAFSLQNNVMRSYPKKQAQADRTKAIYNYRHSRARRVVENGFGILAKYFRIFYIPINVAADTIDSIIVVGCILHNLLRTEKIPCPGETNFGKENFELPTNNLTSLRGSTTRSSSRAYEIRDKFKQFFNDVGRVDWQDEYVFH